MNNASAKLAVQLTLDGGAQFLNVARAGVGALGSIGGAAVKLNQGLFYLIGNISSVKNAFMAMGDGIGNFLKPNIDMETAVLQFETILGSAEAARAKIAELAQFAQTTPFAMPEIMKASRLLQTFGGAALNNEKTLRLVGDAAAATGAQFDEVAFWAGRMYSSIQSGQPFAEAINRFTELGIITSDTASKLRDASDSGNFNGAWDIMISGLGRTSGAMLKLGDSWAGVMSTIGDQWDTIKRKVGEGLFIAMKEDLTGLRNGIDAAFSSGAIDTFAVKAGGAIKGIYAEIKAGFGNINVSDIIAAAEQGKLGAVMREQLGDSVNFFWDKIKERAQADGPSIGRAIFGDSVLSDWLGIGTGQAAKTMAAEGGSKEMLKQTGLLDRGAILGEFMKNNLAALADKLLPGKDYGAEFTGISGAAESWAKGRLNNRAMDESTRRRLKELAEARADGTAHLFPPEFFAGLPSYARNDALGSVRSRGDEERAAKELVAAQQENVRKMREFGAELARQFEVLRNQPAQM
jgi:hypothetical protein